jgi:hypothetical protein
MEPSPSVRLPCPVLLKVILKEQPIYDRFIVLFHSKACLGWYNLSPNELNTTDYRPMDFNIKL